MHPNSFIVKEKKARNQSHAMQNVSNDRVMLDPSRAYPSSEPFFSVSHEMQKKKTLVVHRSHCTLVAIVTIVPIVNIIAIVTLRTLGS